MPPKIYYASRYYDYPALDLLTLLFDSDHCLAKEDTKIHLDAANPSNHLTKASARIITEQWAHSLRHKFGIGNNGPNTDVVIGFCTLHLLAAPAFYATIAAGGIWSAASDSFTPGELARQITQGPAKLVICMPRTKDVAVKAVELCGFPLSRVVLLESSEPWTFKSLDAKVDLFTESRLTWTRITDRDELANSVIILLYSSGTTGVPKGVKVSHQMMVSMFWLQPQVAREWAALRVQSGELTPTPPRTIAHLPVAHIAGVGGYFVSTFYSGGSVYWMGKYDWKQFIHYCREYKTTSFLTVPSILARIAKSPDVTDHFDSVENALSGTAPMDAELQKSAMRKLGKGKVQLYGSYGMSETTGSVCTLFRGMTDDTASVGIIHPNTMLRLVDDDGNDVEDGQPGELLVKGPTLTKGYHRNEEATKQAFSDGWYHTGDILQLRPNGLWYVTDRKKEIIKYKGLQVAPAELEGLLQADPRIRDAAVIGVPFEGTEAPRAYVVADGMSEEEVKKIIQGNLAAYKQLRGGVRFVKEIPRSAVGKLLRRELRDQAKREDRARL